MCPGYDTKPSDGEASVMLELWGMLSTPLLQSLSGSLWSGEVAPVRVLSIDQIELNYVITLNWIVKNQLFLHFTVCKQKIVHLSETELFEIELFLHLKVTDGPVSLGCRIHWLYLCRGVRLP